MYKFYNPNPKNKFVGDCVIRAIAKLEGLDWDTTYLKICFYGFREKNMPAINEVWRAFLLDNGYKRFSIPNICPDCYTVKDFCRENQKGKYLLATGEHVVAVVNGDYYDAWNSGDEVPIYYWRKEN